jgi:dTMP kinase
MSESGINFNQIRKKAAKIYGKKYFKQKNLFISFEGIEGAGKSTQVKLLAEYFKKNGRKVIITHEPGGTEFGKKIREILLETNLNLEPLTEFLLFCADRKEHIEKLIKPSLGEGKIVICDRFTDSSRAYQIGAKNLDKKLVEQLIDWTTAGLKPDLVIYLDISVKDGLERRQKIYNNRFDNFDPEFYKKVRDYYLMLAEENKQWLIINAIKSKEEIFNKIKLELVKKGFL